MATLDIVQGIVRRGGGMARARDFEKAGILRSTLQVLVSRGEIERIDRGVYGIPGEATEHWSRVHIAHRVPGAVFCLVTALNFHEIGTQIPHEVWIAIGHTARRPRLAYPQLRVFRFTARLLAEGVRTYTLRGGGSLRVTTPARTVADCFKFRTRVGIDVAVEALREGYHDRRFRIAEVAEMARLCRVSRIMRPYLEMLI